MVLFLVGVNVNAPTLKLLCQPYQTTNTTERRIIHVSYQTLSRPHLSVSRIILWRPPHINKYFSTKIKLEYCTCTRFIPLYGKRGGALPRFDNTPSIPVFSVTIDTRTKKQNSTKPDQTIFIFVIEISLTNSADQRI